MELKLILFDFSGTLAYFRKSNDLTRFTDILRRAGVRKINPQEINVLFDNLLNKSDNWLDFSRRFLGIIADNPSDAIIKELNHFLKENFRFCLYEDAKEVLDLPIKKAILTSSPRFLLNGLGLEKFAKVFTSEETKFLKPDSRAFLMVLDYFKVSPRESLMIGDSLERDIMPAKQLGMEAILIDRENRINNCPVRKIDSMLQLKKILNLGL